MLYRLSYVGKRLVDREGVEPPNGVAELIYSQRPLATWIPVHLTKSQSLNSEPTARIELATLRLQGGRSAAELRRRMTYFAGENFSPAAPTLYHKEQLGQDVSALVREQIVPAIGTVVKDRLLAQRSGKHGRLILSQNGLAWLHSEMVVANSLRLWYTPAPNPDRIHISHAARSREMCLSLQPSGSHAK
jgi:hypothetical protein